MSENIVYAVIMAGGQGTRLWPISRKARPKQFLDLTGNGFSLLQETVRRGVELTGSIQQVLVLTQAAHAHLVKEQVPNLPQGNLLIEPVGRNTAACLGLAAVHLSQSSGQQLARQPVMVSLPVDHLFVDERPWFTAVRTAIAAASDSDSLVAIGLQPEYPATAYGYQKLGKRLDLDLSLSVHILQEFIEKPAESLAKTLVESGNYLWNTGTYAWKVTSFLAALEKYTPELYAGLQSLGDPMDMEKLEQNYPAFADISVDHAVMEKVTNALTVRANFERIDVGALNSLSEIWKPDIDGNATLGQVLIRDSQENIVYSDQGLVVLLGVKDMIIVRAGEIVLVCPKDKAQEVKNLVTELSKQNLEKYL